MLLNTLDLLIQMGGQEQAGAFMHNTVIGVVTTNARLYQRAG